MQYKYDMMRQAKSYNDFNTLKTLIPTEASFPKTIFIVLKIFS